LRLHLHLLALSFVFSVLKVVKLNIFLFAFLSWSIRLVNLLKLLLDFLEEDSPVKDRVVRVFANNASGIFELK